jgi:hypothetical protein
MGWACAVARASTFKMASLAEAIARGEKTTLCQGSIPVSIEYIAPDATLSRLPVINRAELQISVQIGSGGAPVRREEKEKNQLFSRSIG